MMNVDVSVKARWIEFLWSCYMWNPSVSIVNVKKHVKLTNIDHAKNV